MRPVRRVRKDLPLPFYAQLAEILHDEISEGVWQPGDTLPSEAELCATYDLSRTAIRQALSELAARGLVHKQRGRRTSVSGVTSLVVQELRGFSDEMNERGETVRTIVLRLEIVPASPRVAHELNLGAGTDVVLLSRLRHVADEAIVRVETFLPAPRFSGLVDVDFSDRSLYDVLRSEFGVRPSSGRRAIEAVAADAELAAQLGVPDGSAMLKLNAINFDDDGRAVETFSAWYRGDATRFELVVGS